MAVRIFMDMDVVNVTGTMRINASESTTGGTFFPPVLPQARTLEAWGNEPWKKALAGVSTIVTSITTDTATATIDAAVKVGITRTLMAIALLVALKAQTNLTNLPQPAILRTLMTLVLRAVVNGLMNIIQKTT